MQQGQAVSSIIYICISVPTSIPVTIYFYSSLCVYVYTHVCRMSIYGSIYLSVYLSMYLSTIHPSIHSISISLSPSVYVSIYIPISISIYRLIYLRSMVSGRKRHCSRVQAPVHQVSGALPQSSQEEILGRLLAGHSCIGLLGRIL